MNIKYVHTNIISRDWRRLVAFYEGVLGCEPVPPQRSQSGEWLERGTGGKGARLEGMHLRLPGHGNHGPTLEIYQYASLEENLPPVPNRMGLGHLAFWVEDVEAVLGQIVARGGRAKGKSPIPISQEKATSSSSTRRIPKAISSSFKSGLLGVELR